MINASEEMWDIWSAGDFTGPNRPVTRATISKNQLDTYEGTDYRNILFEKNVQHLEIPNIKRVTISRSVGADAASFELEMVNQEPADVTENLDLSYDGSANSPSKRDLGEFGSPGHYTWRRGQAIDSYGENPWGHAETAWTEIIVPNRLVFIYQGYGTDGATRPVDDTKLVCTGIFIIDNVQYSANGIISMSGRDLSKLLIEQRLFPPIIPVEHYPLEFTSDHYEDVYETVVRDVTQEVTGSTTTASSTGPNVAKHITPSPGPDSSVTPWYGYNATVYGHKASDAFDGDGSTYWLSVGNSGPNEVWSYEWIGALCGGNPVNRVRIKPKWGGYVCWVGVRTSAGWQGSQKVPYGATSEPAYPNGSDVLYVKKINIPKSEAWFDIDLPGIYNAEEIRVVFSNLADSNQGTYQYRAGVYELQAVLYKPSTTEETTSTVVYQKTETITDNVLVEGNINDYTDIVKLMCGWAGFYWPQGTTDPILREWDASASGRVWGDFFNSGAYPVDPWWISADLWDNKSIMDGINQLREILGFTFFIDHAGGVQWRPPNIWRTGNYISGLGYIGEDSIRSVKENDVLIEYAATLNDSNLRSDIVVVSSDDPSIYGSWSAGAATNEATVDISDLELLAGQQRVMLVANYPFISQEEVDKFAYLVALRSHWTFRKSAFKIPGMPAYFPDDQLRIYERVSSETYIHYLTSVTSTMDLDAGTYYMDVQTHWLGNGPDSQWSMASGMSDALFAYLRAIGQINEDGSTVESPFPDEFFDVAIPDIDLDDWRQYTELGDIISDPRSIVDIPDDTTTEPVQQDDYGITGGGNSTLNCSNSMRWEYWQGAGPVSQYVPAGSVSCYTNNLRNIEFSKAWSSYWDLFPAEAPFNTFSGQTNSVWTYVDYRTVGAFQWLAKIMAEAGYEVKSASGFSCRAVKKSDGSSGSNWSNHSWGCAVDINAADNPQGDAVSTLPFASTLRAIAVRAESLRTVAKDSEGNDQRIFRWGGRWSVTDGTVDAMHFEVCVDPDLLAPYNMNAIYEP